MNKEELEALERLLHYARAYNKGDDWKLINAWLQNQKHA